MSRVDELAAQAKQQIDVQLQRRADLVPNLVATVRGYAQQEEAIFIEVARACSGLNFLRLQDELAGTENRIAVARTDYNAAVNQYNAYIRTLPQKLTAMVTGAKPREYFNAPAGTEDPPKIDFSG